MASPLKRLFGILRSSTGFKYGTNSFTRQRLGIAVPVGVAGCYLGYNQVREFRRAHTVLNAAEQKFASQALVNSADFIKSEPWHKTKGVSSQVRFDNNPSDLKITIYQFVSCPFCCKVRAYLDYHGISYDVVEVDSIKRTQKKWTSYKKVPIVVLEKAGQSKMFEQVNDSSVIVSLLHSYHAVSNKLTVNQLIQSFPGIENREGKKKVIEYPNRYFIMYGEEVTHRNIAEMREEREWREWVDNHLVHVLSPNAYRTLSEAFQSFQWFSVIGDWDKNMTTVSRLTCVYLGATVMWMVGGRLRRRHGLDKDVRLSLYNSINDWLAGIGPVRKFMGGEKPNLADLAVYGVLCSIEGTQAFKDLTESTALMSWYAPMQEAVKSHSGQSELCERPYQEQIQRTAKA